jgi:hypothetical protein
MSIPRSSLLLVLLSLVVIPLVACGSRREATKPGAAPDAAPLISTWEDAPPTMERRRRPAPTPPPGPAAPFTPGETGPLPAADRLFAVTLAGGKHRLLGADGPSLWAVEPDATGRARKLWSRTGTGEVQRLVAGEVRGAPERLYVARGRGRAAMDAPLLLQGLDPGTGEGEALFTHRSGRTECTGLDIADVNRDGKPDLAFAYFASKYGVRTHHLVSGGPPVDGAERRMATSLAFADLDGDGKADEVVGRVYGDAQGQPGDLTVHLASGPVRVPTENGVRALLVARLAGDARPTLYLADGWVADYKRSAKGQIKRATWNAAQRAFTVETVATGTGQFTFFALWAVDLGGQGQPVVVAQGSDEVLVFTPGSKRPWPSRSVTRLPPVQNTAIGRVSSGAWALFVPGRPASRTVLLSP